MTVMPAYYYSMFEKTFIRKTEGRGGVESELSQNIY